MMNDSDAIKSALSGREEGYNAIFVNHSAYLFTHALRFTGNRETAEDLVQETFNDAFRFLASFKGQAALRTWLYKILYHKVLKTSAKKTSPALLKEIGETDKSYARVEKSIDTNRVLNMLAERDRSILVLAYWDELKLEEIAEILEISLSNAKVSLFRARQKFARLWHEIVQKGEMANEL